MDTLNSNYTLHSVVSHLNDHYDYLAKIIIIGASSTGKTCLLHRFLKNDFNKLTSQTIGVEFSSKIIKIDDISMKLQLWDTAGQERFRSLTRSYYRGSAGVILVFDLVQRKTLDDLDEFIQDVQTLTNNPSIVLVGNKLDLIEEEDPTLIVRDEHVSEFKRKHNIEDVPYLKTSSLNGDNNQEIFSKITGSILTKVELGIIDPEIPSFGVQYGDVPNWNVSIASKPPQRSGLLIRKKPTTLSLIDRNLDRNNTNRCQC